MLILLGRTRFCKNRVYCHKNNVGYSAISSEAKAHPTRGCMFVSVDGTGATYKLGDIKASGTEYVADIIQFLDPATSVIDNEKVYTYYGEADGATVGEDDGWYTVNDDEELNDIYSNDVEVPAGTAFIVSFEPSHNPTLTCAGQVLKGDVTIDTKVDGTYVAHPFICNPMPTDIKMGTVTMVGGEYVADIIQFVDPVTSVVDMDRVYTYYGEADGATVGEDDGWYTVNDDEEKNDIYSNDVTLKQGDGFLCSIEPSHKIKFVFTSVVD